MTECLGQALDGTDFPFGLVSTPLHLAGMPEIVAMQSQEKYHTI